MAAAVGTAPTTKWVDRYEELRRQVLKEHDQGGWGRALLQRRGLVAWAQAWPSEEDTVAEATTEPVATVATFGVPLVPPQSSAGQSAGQFQEITRVLVDMLLEPRK